MDFFGQFTDHNSGRKYGNQTNDPIFSSTFFRSNCLEHSFLNLNIVKIHFDVVPPFGPFWSVKYLNFGQKLPIQTIHHTFIESRHSEVTKNPYYVLSPEWGQKKVISSWTPTFFVINNQNTIISLIKNTMQDGFYEKAL